MIWKRKDADDLDRKDADPDVWVPVTRRMLLLIAKK